MPSLKQETLTSLPPKWDQIFSIDLAKDTSERVDGEFADYMNTAIRNAKVDSDNIRRSDRTRKLIQKANLSRQQI